MKKLLVLALVAVLMLSMVPAAGAQAPACTPTGYVRDGINLTARLINPSAVVTGPIDAAGCNIGVYYGPGSSGTIDGADIFGSNYYGVVNNGGNVAILNSQVHNIGEVPFNGTQHGVGIYFVYGAASTGRIVGNHVSRYQKGGITINGATAYADVLDNVVAGLGCVDFIAQNGVQFGWGASGVARGNTISGNCYTGGWPWVANPAGKYPPGWLGVSGGLLLYQAGEVKHSMNFYSDNDRNVLVAH